MRHPGDDRTTILAPPGRRVVKALLVNAYSMEQSWAKWEAGVFPGEHVWGAQYLERHGIEVELLPDFRGRVLHALSKWVPDRGQVWSARGIRHLIDQVRTLPRLRHVDIVYSAGQYETTLLALLKGAGLIRTPLAVIVHHRPRGLLRNPLAFKAFFGAHDVFLCLSDEFVDELVTRYGVERHKVTVLQLGVDLPYYPRSAPEPILEATPKVLTAGKTKRDFATLAAAFADLPADLVIYTSWESAPDPATLPPNVTVDFAQATDTLDDYRRSSVVAVPLVPGDDVAGLTSLLQGMVMAKPVVITRSPSIPIDVEKEKVGLWVDPGDTAAWRRAITYLLEHPDEARAMGEAGRRLCEERCNMERFAADVAHALWRAVGRTAPDPARET